MHMDLYCQQKIIISSFLFYIIYMYIYTYQFLSETFFPKMKYLKWSRDHPIY